MKVKWRVRVLVPVIVAIAVLVGQTWLGAQAPEGFELMTDQDLAQETLPAAPLVFAAYSIVWVALLAYVFVLWRKLGRVEQELADVTAQLRAAAND